MELKFDFDTEKNDNDLDQFTIDKDEPQTLKLSELLEIQKSNINEEKEIEIGDEENTSSKMFNTNNKIEFNTNSENINISEDIEYLKELKRGIEKEEKSKKSPKIDEEKYNTRTKNTTKTESKKSKQKKK